MEPKISVIVPSYNAEKTLEMCINSVIYQNYTNLEIIIVNDGSNDNTEIIGQKLARKDPRIKYIYESNAGVSAARNNGLSVATGDYITFLDCDDYLSPETYKSLFSTPEVVNNHPDIIRFQYQTEKNGEIKQYLTDKFGYYDISTDKTIAMYLLITKCQIASTCTALYNSKILKGIKFNTAFSFGEDYLLNFECMCKANSIYIDRHVYYHYCFNGESLTKKVNVEKIKARIKTHFDVDYYIYTEAENYEFFTDFEKDLLYSTYRACENLFGHLAKDLNFAEYSEIQDSMLTEFYYQRYASLDNNAEILAKLNQLISPDTRKYFYDKNSH